MSFTEVTTNLDSKLRCYWMKLWCKMFGQMDCQFVHFESEHSRHKSGVHYVSIIMVNLHVHVIYTDTFAYSL